MEINAEMNKVFGQEMAKLSVKKNYRKKRKTFGLNLINQNGLMVLRKDLKLRVVLGNK